MARTQEVTISTRLGERRINMDKILHFPRGLAGFEDKREFTLLQIRPSAPFLILQSMEEPALGLLVADPYSFMDDYQIKIGDAEQSILQVNDPKQVAVLVTVSIPPGKPEEAALNLTGPILINHEQRLGLQVPQADDARPSKKYLNDNTQSREDAGGAAEGAAQNAAAVPDESAPAAENGDKGETVAAETVNRPQAAGKMENACRAKACNTVEADGLAETAKQPQACDPAENSAPAAADSQPAAVAPPEAVIPSQNTAPAETITRRKGPSADNGR